MWLQTMGMAVMLDEIINYVQSLQNQVDVSWMINLNLNQSRLDRDDSSLFDSTQEGSSRIWFVVLKHLVEFNEARKKNLKSILISFMTL